MFNWSKVHLYQTNFLENPYFKKNNVSYTVPSIEEYNEAYDSRKNKEKSNFDPKNTGKSLSEALLFAEHWENMLCT